MKAIASLEYEKLRQIGAGQGMNSTVYLANDPQLGGEIVVKEVPLTTFVNPFQAYFQEANAMFAVDHPNVVPVHYAGTTATDVCIAMPHYPKGSLADLLAGGPLPVSQVLRFGQDVLAGLARIHAAQYIHFDIKPSNVLISNNNRGMVADFGQSRALGPGGVGDEAASTLRHLRSSRVLLGSGGNSLGGCVPGRSSPVSSCERRRLLEPTDPH